MEKLKMQTANKADENFKKLAEMFPNAVTETIDENGEIVRAIDKDVLMQEISCKVVDGNEERYQFTWPDKKKSVLLANAPINKTLRPCREESVDFDNTENLYIEGDNLEVLKLLQETYLGKIKMIYIDPPYNTGNDFVYNDEFGMRNEEWNEVSGNYDEDGNQITGKLEKNTENNGRFHTDWLNMIYPRLKLAKDLLSDDGIIFVSIDEHESHNMRKICDEIFGVENFISQIVWEKRYTRSNNAKRFTTLTEPIICYVKSITTVTDIKEKRSDKADSIYSNPDNDPRGAWTSVSYVNPATKEQRPNLVYPILNPITGAIVEHPTNAWKYEKSTYDKHIQENRLYWGKAGENTYPRLKKFLSEMDGGMVPVDLWRQEDTGTTDQGSKELESLLGRKIFDFPKPQSLVKRIISLILNGDNGKNNIILDFFSGSATTAHAVMQLNAEDGGNRKFIMVQLPEETDKKSEAYKAGYKNICEIGKERIRRAGQKIRNEQLGIKNEGDNSSLQTPNSSLDTGFRVFKCDSSNMKDVYYNPAEYEPSLFSSLEDNIKEDRTPEDLLFQVMLDLGILLSSKIQVRSEKVGMRNYSYFDVEDGYLIACFDKNIDEEVITAIAKQKPYYFVMRDSSMANDSVATNFEQIFAAYSPDTVRKVL